MTRPFKVGDRVRLISLQGKLSDEVHVLHDIWGDETCPRNASFMYGNSETFTHTDLMKHEDDTTPVVVPDGGEWYIARGNNMGWGRGKTAEAAIANMKRQGGKITEHVVHRVSKWTQVDGMGALGYPMGIEPVEVKRVTKKKVA